MNTQTEQTTFLVPIHFSPGSLRAARTALTMARAMDARVEFLHVRDLAEYGLGGAAMTGIPDVWTYQPMPPVDVDGLWERFLAKLDLDDVDWERHTEVGRPAAAILDRARALDCSMIVMGAGSTTGLLRLLSPDVARQVTRHAPCSVVTVNPSKEITSPRRMPHRFPADETVPAVAAHEADFGWTPAPAFA